MEERILPNPGTLESILCDRYPEDFEHDDFKNENKGQLGNKIKEKMSEAILFSIKNEGCTLDFSEDLVFWSNSGNISFASLPQTIKLIDILETVFGEKYEDLKEVTNIVADNRGLKIFPNINPSFLKNEEKIIKIHDLNIEDNPELNDSNYRLGNPIVFRICAENTALKKPQVSMLDEAMEEKESPCPSCQNCLIQ
jgi:hypothetical protein